VTSSFVLQYVDLPLDESGDCFKFVYDGRHLVTGPDNLAHEDLIENLEAVASRKPDRPSLTLGWIWVRARDASYTLAYKTDDNSDIERRLKTWLRDGGPEDARAY
jgi:hypothetical protein